MKWNPNGELEVIPSINGYITFRFSNEEDMYYVLLVVHRLSLVHPCFGEAEKEKTNHDIVSKFTLWIWFPSLPNEYRIGI